MLYSFSKKLHKSWRFLAIITLFAVILSLALSYTSTPLYRAKATFLVFPNANLSSSRDVLTSLDTLDKRTNINTYALILSSYQVFKNTLASTELSDIDFIDYVPKTEVQTDANIINLYVEGPDPVVAAQLANNIGQNGIEYIKGIHQVFDIAFLDIAIENPSLPPFFPQPLESMIYYAVSGFLAAILMVLLSSFIQAPIDAIRQRMMRDPESNAFTRQHFIRQTEREISKDAVTPISFVLLELVGLEGLLERLPDPVQTEILSSITGMLHNQLRGNDLVGRWDINKFSILLLSTPGDPASRIMERLRKQMGEPITIEATGEKMDMLPIIGIAERTAEDDVSRLSGHAETAARIARTSTEKTILFQADLEGENE